MCLLHMWLAETGTLAQSKKSSSTLKYFVVWEIPHTFKFLWVTYLANIFAFFKGSSSPNHAGNSRKHRCHVQGTTDRRCCAKALKSTYIYSTISSLLPVPETEFLIQCSSMQSSLTRFLKLGRVTVYWNYGCQYEVFSLQIAVILQNYALQIIEIQS